MSFNWKAAAWASAAAVAVVLGSWVFGEWLILLWRHFGLRWAGVVGFLSLAVPFVVAVGLVMPRQKPNRSNGEAE